MRKRMGNPYRDQHGLFDKDFTMKMYDFVTYPGTDPHSIAQVIEYIIPELTVFARGKIQKQRTWAGDHWEEQTIDTQDGNLDKQGWANGAVWTSWRTDDINESPCLHVSIGLYIKPCDNPKCMAGHMNNKNNPIYYRSAPKLEPWQIDAIKEEVGEHDDYRLGNSLNMDQDILSRLGFTPLDAPLKNEEISADNIKRSLDYLSRTDIGSFIYKATELHKRDYPVDMELVGYLAKSRDLR